MRKQFFAMTIFSMAAMLCASLVFSGIAIAEESTAQGVAAKKNVSPRRDDPTQVMQQKVKKLVASGVSLDHYAIALAQAWIDYAREAYFRKDRAVSATALGEAELVVDAIERDGAEANVQARLMPSSKRLRDDLWRKADAFKQNAEFHCATWPTARMEIALVAAGHADQDMGWRATRPFVQRAERFAREAEAKMKACAEPKPAPTVDKPAEDKKPVEDATVVTPTEGKIIDTAPGQGMPDRVHFGRESAEISDVSALVLEQVSYVLRANPSIVLDVLGFADELSTADENQKLALARAQAVQEYLIETGVGRERLMVRLGKQDSSPGKTALERAKARRVEFVPTNSERIPTEYQDKDLATEGPQS